MKVYKIRNKKTGLYKTKGQWCDMSQDGDVFKTLAHSRGSLTQSCNKMSGYNRLDFEIVEFELVEVRTYE